MLSYGTRFIKKIEKDSPCQYLIADMKKNLHVQRSTVTASNFKKISRPNRLISVASGTTLNDGNASKIALSTLLDYFTENAPWFETTKGKDQYEVYDKLESAVECSHIAVQTFTRRKHANMSIAYIVWPYLHVVHVGNHHCYIYRNQRLIPIKSSLVSYKKRSKNCLGKNGYEIDFCRKKLFPGDKLLVCTHGLLKNMSLKTVVAVMGRCNIRNICREFVDITKSKEDKNNFSAIATQFGKLKEQSLRNMNAESAIWSTVNTKKKREIFFPRSRYRALNDLIKV